MFPRDLGSVCDGVGDGCRVAAFKRSYTHFVNVLLSKYFNWPSISGQINSRPSPVNSLSYKWAFDRHWSLLACSGYLENSDYFPHPHVDSVDGAWEDQAAEWYERTLKQRLGYQVRWKGNTKRQWLASLLVTWLLKLDCWRLICNLSIKSWWSLEWGKKKNC